MAENDPKESSPYEVIWTQDEVTKSIHFAVLTKLVGTCLNILNKAISDHSEYTCTEKSRAALQEAITSLQRALRTIVEEV